MEAFYKNRIEKDKKRRLESNQRAPETSKKDSRIGEGDNTDATNSNPTPSTSQQNVTPQQPSDIVYENDFLRLKVEKGSFKKQKNFRLQDHLFHFKIEQKKTHESLPLLSEIFDFLHAALLHVLESTKTFYKPEDHNIAYLTLHQEPMINGLNTGLFK